MKKNSKVSALLALFTAVIMFAACEKNDPIVLPQSAAASTALTSARAALQPITIFATSDDVLPDNSTYTGPVTVTGVINATGTFVMPTKVIGMALHCRFILTLPNGNITIRMNCNMVTFNGQWQIIGGTGIYENLKGNGSLVMPNDTDEILTGTVHWE